MEYKSVREIGNHCLELMIQEVLDHTKQDSVTISKNISARMICISNFISLFMNDTNPKQAYDDILSMNVAGIFNSKQVYETWNLFCAATSHEANMPNRFGKNNPVDIVPFTEKDFLNLGYKKGFIAPPPSKLALLTSSMDDIYTIKTQGES